MGSDGLIMETNKIRAIFSVGTRFIASGDSSLRMVSMHVLLVFILVQGDESPDGIHAVPTG